jgi:hypothetical protein
MTPDEERLYPTTPDKAEEDIDEDEELERRAFETRDMLHALAGRQPMPADDLYRDNTNAGGWALVSYCFPCCFGWAIVALLVSRLQFSLACYVLAAMTLSYGVGQIREKILFRRRSQVTSVSLGENIAALHELKDVAFASDILYAYTYLEERDPILAAAVVRILGRVKASDRHLFDNEVQTTLRSALNTSQVPEVRMAVIEALFQVGDGEAYKAVEPILASPVCRENPESLRERAREILPELLNRAKEAEATNKLLRPATTEEEKLLRPAGNSATDEAQLLRPTEADASE